MRMKMPSMASRIGVKMRRIRPGRGCCLWMTRVLGFCVTVTKALRTCVPFNCVGRLDSCLRDLVVGYQVKSANRRESHEDFSTEAKREAKGPRYANLGPSTLNDLDVQLAPSRAIAAFSSVVRE